MNRHNLNEYWKTVVDSIQDGVMIVDPDGTIVSANRAFEEITGYPHREILGQSCTTLNCSSCEIAREEPGCHWCVMFRKGNLSRQRCTLVRKDGRTVTILKNASVIRDSEGHVTGAVETMTDITDLVSKETQIESFRRELRAADRFHGMIGVSPAMRRVFDLVANAAQSDAPVIIYGESGTGKELVARAIHAESDRAEKPFIALNCAAIPENLLESELFGHVKGAFTGAVGNKSGLFELADLGTLFLDEVGELTPPLQVKLLRAIQEKTIRRVGGTSDRRVDVRILAATNRRLEDEVAAGRFREDLYYRLNVIQIGLPPLRDRSEDIPLLVQHFVEKYAGELGKPVPAFSEAAMKRLLDYPFPGNVRELENMVERAVALSPGGTIGPESLPPSVLEPTARGSAAKLPADGANLDSLVNEFERGLLREALRQSRGVKKRAAHLLGISFRSFRYRLEKLGMEEAPDEED